MKKIFFSSVGFLFLFAIIFSAWKYLQDDIAVVEVVSPEEGPIQSTIRVTGRVINDRTVTLTALVNGQIQEMLVQKGDKVKAGQVLAYLDKREADALIEKATAVVARERQAVTEAKRKYERLRKISLAGNASDQTVEDTEAQWHAAQGRLLVAEAEQRIAEIHREKVEVTAPWDGVIIEKSAEQGQWIEAGIKIFQLVAEEGREIEANVDAGDSGVVKIGQAVTLTCDAFPGHEWKETIHWISPAIMRDKDSVLNSFAVRTTLGKDAPSLLLGQQVDISIRTAHKESSLKLPYATLIESDDKTKVAVVRNNKVKYLTIKTGIEDLTHVEIIAGVDKDDSVIHFHNKAPKENSTVTIKPVNP